MGFKPEDICIPYDLYNEIPKPNSLPKAYDQAFVDNLLEELEYYKRRYRDELIKNIRNKR